ncbi:MAG: NADPH:quinone reductase [Burkholderiales bacterium]|nr:NADPH:quinone reductase [Burkholderiales bacterium]
MRAAFYKTTGPAAQVLEVGTLPTPQPGPGEVRVRLAYSGVNPSDVKSRSGASNRGWNFPVTVPHSDGAGTIDALGAGVDADLLGRRVWVYNGQWERAFGTAAEYITLPAAQAVPLPDSVSFEAGASVGIPLMTAFHALAACGSVIGRTVLVSGAAGSVGSYATQLARLGGARVIATVSGEAKAALARAAGAHEVVNYRDEDVAARVRELTGARGADFIIDVDASGNAARYGQLLAFGGKAVIYGSNAREFAVPFGPMISGLVTMYFFIVYKLPAQEMRDTVAGVAQLLAQGVLAHPPAAVFGLDDIAAAHQRVEAGANAKVLIRL